MKIANLTYYGSNAPLSTASPLPTAVEHASVAGYEYTAPQQVNAFTSGYENILDMGFLSGMDTFPDMGSLFGSDVPIPGAGSQWASNHSDEYGEVSDEPAATGTGNTETTGSGQGGEAAANTTDDVEHSEENTATDNADSTDNGDTQGNEDEYMQPGTDDTAEENEETVISTEDNSADSLTLTGENAENAQDKPETAGSTQTTGGESPGTIHPDSFAAQNKDWDFGDGGIKDNPATADYVRQQYVNIYGVEPTVEQLEAMVQTITSLAQTQPASAFDGNYIELCNTVVAAGSDAQLTGEPAGKDEVQQHTGEQGNQESGVPKVYGAEPLPGSNNQNNSGGSGGLTEEINSYKSKIFDMERKLSNAANINGKTYNEIKKLVDELVKKAESHQAYKELAYQAQSLMQKFMKAEDNKLKKMNPVERRKYIADNIEVQNPSPNEIKAEVKEILKSLNISEEFLPFVYAMIQKESSWRHSSQAGDVDHTGAELIPGEIVLGANDKYKDGKPIPTNKRSTDIGLCQINDRAQKHLNYSMLARDWRYNLEQGITILRDNYIIAKNYLEDKNIPRTAENLAIATYAAYNGGRGSVGRSFKITNGNETEVHENDSVYLDYFKDYAKRLGISLW